MANQEKWRKYEYRDPFPEIDAALLNSADIEDYVNATGMINPFDKSKLKSASYAATIKGVCKYWNDEGKLEEEKLEGSDDIFELKPNSIAFVEIEPEFKLPRYIALRFNLKITHVYRGLLLGTGPLIDPGYHGKIYIPLHNLTSNTYKLRGGDDLIWIEFTKTSPIKEDESKQGESLPRDGVYAPFPEVKRNQKLEYFLNKANDGGPITNSIAHAVESSKRSAASSEESAKDVAKNIQKIGWGGIVTIVLGMIAIVFPVYEMQTSYVWRLSNVNEVVSRNNALLIKQEKDVLNSESEIRGLIESRKQQIKNLIKINNELSQLKESTSTYNIVREMKKSMADQEKKIVVLIKKIQRLEKRLKKASEN